MEEFCNTLMRNLQRFIEVEDNSGAETIWTCCITCLAHLSALSHFVSQAELTLTSSMDDLCDMTLDKLGDLAREVRVEDYSYFDVLTVVRVSAMSLRMSRELTKNADQISLERALDTIDARIELRSHAESESLRYWRVVIGRVHGNFQTNLRGSGPVPLMSLALLEDGRTDDSSFPNLLLHAGREAYGF